MDLVGIGISLRKLRGHPGQLNRTPFLSDKLLFGHTRVPACAGMTTNGRFRIGDTSESTTNT